MAGSTLEAMAKAVEASSCVCIFLNEDYKESSACRLEAEYAHQKGKRMVFCKVEDGYSPDGWLGVQRSSCRVGNAPFA